MNARRQIDSAVSSGAMVPPVRQRFRRRITRRANRIGVSRVVEGDDKLRSTRPVASVRKALRTTQRTHRRRFKEDAHELTPCFFEDDLGFVPETKNHENHLHAVVCVVQIQTSERDYSNRTSKTENAGRIDQLGL